MLTSLRPFALVGLLLCAGLVHAMPSTAHFGALDTEVAERQAALPTTGLTKDQKKERSALKKYGKAVGKNHKDLLKDVQTGAKVDRFLAKVYSDEEMNGLLENLLGNLAGDVRTRFDTLDGRVDALNAAAKPLVAANKARDKAAEFLVTAETAGDHKTAYKFFKKALVKVRVGEKQATKAENAGGGGGGGGNGIQCNGRTPTGTEFADLTVNGSTVSADNLSVSVTRDGMGPITEYRLSVAACDPGGNHSYAIVIEGEPLVGFYSFGTIGGTRGSVTLVTGGPFNRFLTGAQIQITAYNAQTGTVEGMVTNASDPILNILFRSESGF